ncbi:DHA2 family efflux MFS transporter permease subunit [Paenibacillus dendritiformis]|uniref:EmrB/QacA subfamily drug resistance transporter n=1 Tax=Paenibacillus dendritiformis C454 TaxID=1131935 RepID=H3SN48_9BACL|nr:DHA2 family efflux MFS transporter permease subunit [Paenibacillus dendritiformis]EHQ59479.1 EmrB/QacA subfamily drug resistance transporter [Paenibacillus dendritiformis C454]CAH8768819.1 DHA2 family efflux MFS transporter permease subunit [Paenibacillus dendritiformis]
MKKGLNPKTAVCIVYVAAMFTVAMDATVLNVALQTISQELQVPPAASGVLNVGYLVSLAVVLPAAGWLGDKWGTKRAFLLALALFTVASALCGFASSLTALTIFRVVQGIGGGLLTPIGMAMLFRMFPPQERAKVSRALILPIAVAPAVGPILSGLLIEHLSWRWIFYVHLPIGIPALLFGIVFLKEHREHEAGRLDVRGLLLSAPGLALLMYALSQGPVQGWDSPAIWATGGMGLILIAALVAVELRVKQPLLDLRLLSDRLFRTAGLVAMCSAAGLLGMLYVFPLMYQNALHASALDTGLTTFPEALGLMLASQLVPWTYPRLGPKRVMIMGLLCTAILFVMLSTVGPHTNPWLIRSLLFGVGVFLGHTVGAVQIAAFANIPPASMGRASTWFTVQNRLGPAIGLAVLSGILAVAGTHTINASGGIEPNIMAYRAALLGAASFLLMGLGCALRIRDSDAASTIRKQAPVKPDGENSVQA